MGLSGAGTGNDEQMPALVEDRPLLRFIYICEDRVGFAFEVRSRAGFLRVRRLALFFSGFLVPDLPAFFRFCAVAGPKRFSWPMMAFRSASVKSFTVPNSPS